MSSTYIGADDFELLEGNESLAVYQFGDRGLSHLFCKTCGISPFNLVVSVPPSYEGPARPGARRVNLGCVAGVDPLALKIDLINGRDF